MKKIKIILLALAVLAVPLFVFTSGVQAGSFHSGDNVVIKKGETIDHTVFVAGNNVEVNGTIKGDLFCAGQNITINAVVEGDVLCAGMNVDISGTVMGDVRAAGQVVTLSAKVNHNASLAGNMVKTESGSKVNDLQAAGNSTILNGTTMRDADVAGSSVTINGMIGRDVQATTDNLRLDAGANVAGNVTYYSHNQLQTADASHVSGKTARKDPPQRETERQTNPVPGVILSFFMSLTLAFVLLAVFPRKLKVLSDLALTKPGTTVLIGLAACIGVPIVILLSFITVVGALLGIVLLLGWIVVLLLSGVLTSYYAGRLVLMRSPQHPFTAMLVGVLLISVLMLIPIVNIVTMIAVILFGSGMIVRELFAKTTKPSYERPNHPVKKAAHKA
jgi:cytoskeletal protein CcmA (bactofilin family)